MDMITTNEHVKMEDQIHIIVRQSMFLFFFHAFTCLYTYIAIIILISLAIDIRDSTGTVI